MPTFGRINLNEREVSNILNQQPIHLGWLDKIWDCFRPQTKRETIEHLVQLMQSPAEHPETAAQTYLHNFEVIASHAKTEQLRQFSLSVVQKGTDGIAELQFRIGEHSVASHEVDATGYVDDLVSLGALYRLRGEAADTKASHELCRYASHEAITGLIEHSTSNIDGARRRYGEFVRQLAKDISAAGVSGRRSRKRLRRRRRPPRRIHSRRSARSSGSPFEESSESAHFLAPAAQPGVPVEPIGFIRGSSTLSAVPRKSTYEPLSSATSALDVLTAVEAQVIEEAGPRAVVRDLKKCLIGAALQVEKLINHDADFSGANLQPLLLGGANFKGVSVQMLRSVGASFEGVNLRLLQGPRRIH